MPKQKLIALIAVVTMATGAVVLKSRNTQKAPEAAPAPTQADLRPARPQPVVTLEMAAAVREGKVRVDFKTNGRDKLRGQFASTSAEPIRVHVSAGQLFETADSAVVLIRDGDLELKAKETRLEDFSTCATTSANKLVAAPCAPVGGSLPKLGALIAHLQNHPEISSGAAQTAVLALTENLPVSSFAKFSQPGAELPSQFDTSAFKVDTGDIIGALAVLREIGISDSQLALSVDPQLKIEAMIDPLAHAAAMRYYGITPQTEWDFWKRQLLSGEGATRHYALFGIARFYPDVALQMLPAWVREPRTNAVYRASAVQALAETQRPEALSVLRQLQFELGARSELGRAAKTAADFLDTRLNKTTAGSKPPVQFRVDSDLPKQAAITLGAPIIAAVN